MTLRRSRRRIFLLFPLAAVLSIHLQAQDSGSYTGPIIDMHLHAGSTLRRLPDGTPAPRGCSPQPCTPLQSQVQSGDERLRLTLDAMDRNHIVLGFLSGDTLEETYAWQDAAPGRFLASPYVQDPDLVDLDSLRREYLAGRLRGMGELAHQYEGIALDDPRIVALFALADEFDVPVLIHHHGTGGPSDRFRISLGRPEQLEDLLVRFPNVSVVVEAAGFPFLEETIAVMYRYPNVYGDLSLWKYPVSAAEKYLRELVEAGLSKRLVFGSDQNQWPESIDDIFDLINSAAYLTPEQKADIFYNNAARLLTLTAEEIASHHSR